MLGEGTFLDLLRFVERHAPAAAARLAHRDERRYVHLSACGFDETVARHISDLHTPNLM